jgi:hypothetical protein
MAPSAGSLIAFHWLLAGNVYEKVRPMPLEALRKWRFSPAYQGGRAVDSTLEVRLTISAAR